MFRVETGDGYGGVRERRMPGTRGFNRSKRGHFKNIIIALAHGVGRGRRDWTHLSVLLLTMPLRSNLASTLKHQTSAMVSRTRQSPRVRASS